MSQTIAYYKRHRFPAAIIAHAVWLYLCVSLSLRAVEELLLERGRGLPRDAAAVGGQVRPRDRSGAAASSAPSRRRVAPR